MPDLNDLQKQVDQQIEQQRKELTDKLNSVELWKKLNNSLEEAILKSLVKVIVDRSINDAVTLEFKDDSSRLNNKVRAMTSLVQQAIKANLV